MASNKHNEERATVVENLDSHLTKAGQKVAGNKKIIYIAVGAIAVVAAFVLSYLFIYRNPRLQNSWESYNKVLLMQQRDNASDSLLAIEFQKVATNFSSTPAGDAAALASAEYFYNEKKYDSAIKVLEKLGLSEPVLQSQAKALLGDCYVNQEAGKEGKGAKGNYDKALECFDQAIKIADGNPELVPLYLIKKANVYNHLGQYDKSLACYEEIKAKYPNYTFGNGIEYYIEREKALGGK